MPPVEFELGIPTEEWLQIHALEGAATVMSYFTNSIIFSGKTEIWWI